jgi:hypothetical protein
LTQRCTIALDPAVIAQGFKNNGQSKPEPGKFADRYRLVQILTRAFSRL